MQEFELIMSKSALFEKFESSWPKWEKAILGYASGTKNKTKGLCWALKDLHSESTADSDDDTEGNTGEGIGILVMCARVLVLII